MNKKKKARKVVLIVVILFLVFFVIGPGVATKIVCDNIFKRYDKEAEVKDEYKSLKENHVDYRFTCKGNELQGYLYEAENATALVVLAPGLHAGAFDYLPVIETFLENNMSVFTFDPTGTRQSEGNSNIGFAQEVYDLEAALDFAKSKNNFGFEDVFLLGHSRGGVASCAVLNEDYDIDALVAVSTMNEPMDAIMGTSVGKVGKFAYANYPFLYLYQKICCGSATDTDSINEINKSGKSVLIVQGASDDTYTTDAFSIYAEKDSITSDKAECYLKTEAGQDGHTSVLYDADGSSSDELMNKIITFYEESVK